MANITVDDATGTKQSVVIFPKVYEQCAPLIQPKDVLFIRGKIAPDRFGDDLQLHADLVLNLDEETAEQVALLPLAPRETPTPLSLHAAVATPEPRGGARTSSTLRT